MLYEILLLTGAVYLITSYNIQTIARLLFTFADEESSVIWWLSLLFLPGIFLHETSHLVVAELSLVRTHNFSLIPEVMSDGGVKLGSVQVQKTDPIRRLIIGVAPLLLGAVFISVATYFVIKWSNIYMYVAYAYCLFQISHTCFSSKKDLEGFFVGVLCVFVLFFSARFLILKADLPALYESLGRFENFFSVYIPYLRDGIRFTVLTDVVFLVLVRILLVLRRKRQ